MAIPLADALDLEEERRRLSREMEKVNRELEAAEGKLNNPTFMERAPAEVVEKVRSSHRELMERRSKLAGSLSDLQAPGAAPPDR
jgi:valyl-tRNA synthetase